MRRKDALTRLQTAKPRYITEIEVAEITGIRPQTLRNHRFLDKGLPYIKKGHIVRYSLADVIAWMEAGRIIPGGGE